MKKYENHCCDCAVPAYPCRAPYCDNLRVPVYYCDKCRLEIPETVYIVDGEELCEDCLKEMFRRDDID